jgi:ribosomal protein S27E
MTKVNFGGADTRCPSCRSTNVTFKHGDDSLLPKCNKCGHIWDPEYVRCGECGSKAVTYAKGGQFYCWSCHEVVDGPSVTPYLRQLKRRWDQ